jgi:hypothetical protein
MSTVSLLDHVHRFQLRRTEPGAFSFFRTTLIFVYLCLHCFSTSDDPGQYLTTEFDDCGRLGVVLVTFVTKALLLEGATCVKGQRFWCADISDDGTRDEVRLLAVECLILLRLFGCSFLEFPKNGFVTSTVNILVEFHCPSQAFKVHDPGLRFRVVHACMLLMSVSGCSLDDLRVDDDRVARVCRPLVDSMNRDWPVSVVETYYLPFMIHFLDARDDRFHQAVNATFLENLLHTTDWSREVAMREVSVYALARLCDVPEMAPVLSAECAEYDSDFVTQAGSWMHVLMQVVIRTVQAEPTQFATDVLVPLVVGHIDCCAALPDSSLKLLFKIIADNLSFESQIVVIKAIHWAIGSARPEYVRLAAFVLTELGMFQKIADDHPDVPELAQIIEWAGRQIELSKGLQEAFTYKEIAALLSTRDNCVPTFDVAEEAEKVPFNFEGMREGVWEKLVNSYLVDTVRLPAKPDRSKPQQA